MTARWLSLISKYHLPDGFRDIHQPRDTAHSVLRAVIREHLEPFLGEGSARGDCSGQPRFVEQAFREFVAPKGQRGQPRPRTD